jgi:hypothetical protein
MGEAAQIILCISTPNFAFVMSLLLLSGSEPRVPEELLQATSKTFEANIECRGYYGTNLKILNHLSFGRALDRKLEAAQKPKVKARRKDLVPYDGPSWTQSFNHRASAKGSFRKPGFR